MPKIVVTDSKGLVQETGKGVVGLVQTKIVKSQLVGADLVSGAIEVPANSLITGVHAVVTKQLVGGANTVNIKVGTVEDGNQLAVSRTLANNPASATVGKGTSTAPEIRAALQGNTVIVLTAGSTYRQEDTQVHITVESNNLLTDGEFQFTVEFITFS